MSVVKIRQKTELFLKQYRGFDKYAEDNPSVFIFASASNIIIFTV